MTTFPGTEVAVRVGVWGRSHEVISVNRAANTHHPRACSSISLVGNRRIMNSVVRRCSFHPVCAISSVAASDYCGVAVLPISARLALIQFGLSTQWTERGSVLSPRDGASGESYPPPSSLCGDASCSAPTPIKSDWAATPVGSVGCRFFVSDTGRGRHRSQLVTPPCITLSLTVSLTSSLTVPRPHP